MKFYNKLLVVVLIMSAGCATTRTPKTLRLESLRECARSAWVFCQRSVSPADVCLSQVVKEYCE